MYKRSLRYLLLAVLVVGLLPALVASAVTTAEPYQAMPIAVARYGQVQPAIEYPWVVYKSEQSAESSPDADQYEPFTDIYARNMITGQTKLICGVAGEQSNPDISGTRVVYSDNRKNPTSDDNGYCDIYMYDISSGKESVICSATGGQGNPSIDGNVVVWTDGREGGEGSSGGDIYMKNLSTGLESAISTETQSDYEPVVNDGYIVWSDQDSYEVKLYNLSSKQTTTVATSPRGNEYVYDPFVADGYVAFYRRFYNGSENEYTIELYDIATRQTKVISTSLVSWRYHPEIGGGWVTWHDNRSGSQEVYGYHIQSRVERRLVAGSVDSEGDDTKAGRTAVGTTDVNGRALVVWHDHRNESLPASTTLNPDGVDSDDLYAMYLTDMFGPVIDVAGVEDGLMYTEGVKPVVTCDEGRPVTVTLNGVPTSLANTITAEGIYKLVGTARDALGNPGRVDVTFAINLDQAPAGTMQLCGGSSVVNSRNITIDSSITDAEDIQMRYSLDGGAYTSWMDYAAKAPVTVIGEGFHDVLAQYQDESGNTCSRWDWVYVDSTPGPLTLGTPKSVSTVRRGVKFTVSGTVSPTHIGAGTVRIYKYRYVSGKWKGYGYTNVLVNSTGTGYTGKVALPYAGKWRLRAYHVDTGHTASWSKYLKSVTVN